MLRRYSKQNRKINKILFPLMLFLILENIMAMEEENKNIESIGGEIIEGQYGKTPSDDENSLITDNVPIEGKEENSLSRSPSSSSSSNSSNDSSKKEEIEASYVQMEENKLKEGRNSDSLAKSLSYHLCLLGS